MGCTHTSEVEFKQLGSFCKDCFIKLLKKRVKKEFGKYEWFKKDEKVLLVNKHDAASHLLSRVFYEITSDMPLKLEEKPSVDEGYERVLLPTIADETAISFLNEILQGKKMEKLPANFMLPLQCIRKEELSVYAKFENLPFDFSNSRTQEFLDTLEENYPGTKFSIIKSMGNLN